MRNHLTLTEQSNVTLQWINSKGKLYTLEGVLDGVAISEEQDYDEIYYSRNYITDSTIKLEGTFVRGPNGTQYTIKESTVPMKKRVEVRRVAELTIKQAAEIAGAPEGYKWEIQPEQYIFEWEE